MNKEDFELMLDKVLDGGVEISIFKEKESGIVWYNMNTEMKSHLHIALIEDKCVFKARYDKVGEIKSYDDLLDEVLDCQCSRDFGSASWFNILEHRYDVVETKKIKM